MKRQNRQQSNRHSPNQEMSYGYLMASSALHWHYSRNACSNSPVNI
uniref:Uncharacterized protein n=1 Tax=Anguilla anguilla TaxID=7936 RepID=A0A0E9U011_ANGAN